MSYDMHLLVDNNNYSKNNINQNQNNNHNHTTRKLTDKELHDMAIMKNIQLHQEEKFTKRLEKELSEKALAAKERKIKKQKIKEMIPYEIDKIYYAIMDCVEEISNQGEHKIVIWFPMVRDAWIPAGRLYHHDKGKCIWWDWINEYEKWDGYMDPNLLDYIFQYKFLELTPHNLKHMKHRVKKHNVNIHINYCPEIGFASINLSWHDL